MTEPNLAKLIQEAARLREQQHEFMCKHKAIEVLHSMDHHVSQFLAKRLGQGRATAIWSPIYTNCLRLTVMYRGREWSLRVPVQP